MSYTLRFHQGTNTLNGWDVSAKYNNKAIADIKDPSGGAASLPITSVPTPFATFELVRNAYEQVLAIYNNTGEIEGNTFYHKLVSYSLDLLEILSNFSKYQNDFEIIPWDIQTDLQNLLTAQNAAHQALGETLDLFLDQDKGSFNFSDLRTLYLLNYKNGPAVYNIVGGTSPTSLTVASSNDLSYVDVYLGNGHKAFDTNYLSLIGRSAEFFEYMFKLADYKDSNGFSFAGYFSEVYNYINTCFTLMKDNSLKGQLRAQQGTNSYQEDYLPISGQNFYFIGQIPILEQRGQEQKIQTSSDFRVLTDKVEGAVPLALPNQPYARQGMRYTTGFWDARNKAPYVDSDSIDNRTLPFDGTQYPYLVADDLFQPYLIKLVYPIDASRFFTAHNEQDSFAYLIPLKNTIFNYFDADFLEGSDRYGQPIFELKDISNGVKAILRIPVQKNEYITYERLYLDSNNDPDVENNEGVIRECTFDLFIFPFFHTANQLRKPQRIYLMDGDRKSLTMNYEYDIHAYRNDGTPVALDKVDRENKRTNNNPMTTKYFLSNEEYDYLVVSNGTAEAVILPKWKICQSQGKEYSFAIDFGTTNTHIEYKTSVDNDSKALDYSFAESIVASLHKDNASVIDMLFNKDLREFFTQNKQEFLPLLLGNKDAHFPMRTNLCVLGALDRSKPVVKALSEASIGFHYEKEPTALHNISMTNLKWEGGGDTPFVSAYIEELLFIIMAKIISDGGDLDKTKIVWFYPISMLNFQKSQLEMTWKSLVSKYISDKASVIGYTESVAPYFFYKNKQGVTSSKRPVASIDIGGGTTDTVVYEHNIPKIISSSRFAGNNLYGDFFGFGISNNGYVMRYGTKVKSLIGGTMMSSCYDNIYGKGRSSDLISFMFSLKDNQTLKQNNIIVDFSDMLTKDYPMKIVMLLFYAAEIYHIAKILKAKGIGTPAYLTVSGTASKMLNILAASNEPLEAMASAIFNEVLGDSEKVVLKTVPFPKEITCKGGLNIVDEDVNIDTDGLRFNVSGSETFDSSNKLFSNINDIVEKEVINEYTNFIDFFFSMNDNKACRFYDKFGIENSDFATYKTILTEYAAEDLNTVIDARRKELKEDDSEINDSLFFYPLSGGINRLSNYIANNK